MHGDVVVGRAEKAAFVQPRGGMNSSYIPSPRKQGTRGQCSSRPARAAADVVEGDAIRNRGGA